MGEGRTGEGRVTLAQKRIALYARFSSDRQSAASVEDQLARCAKWVAERGGSVRAEHVFADRAVSAASMQRAGWTALERAIGSGSIDTIVVESLDRVSRKTGDTMQLIERLKFAGITLHAIADGLDTSTRSAKMHGAFKGLMSDMFLDDLADKTKRGMEGRARAGKSTGGLPYGYRSRATEKIGSRIAELRIAAKLTQGELASRLGLTSGMAVSRWETGTTRPNAEHLLALARIFGVSADSMAGGHEPTVITVDTDGRGQ